MKYFTVMFLFFFTLFIGCSEFFITPEEMKGDYLGLRSIEHKQALFFYESYTELEIPYNGRVNSKRYELRLYFPSIDSTDIDSIFKTQIVEGLLTNLNGMEAHIIDESSNEVLKSKVILTKKDLSFNQSPRAPFSIWLWSGLSLKRGENYKIRLKVPPMRENRSEYEDVLLVLGIGNTPML